MCSCSLPIGIHATGNISSVTLKHLWLPLVNLQLNIAKISKLETGCFVQTNTDEEDEYINLGVYKNYCGSFSKNVNENIAKTRKKVGMLLSANLVRKCVNPMIYLKFWKQACIPMLLFGTEIWSLTSMHLEKLERCQRWFVDRFFHLPDYTSNDNYQPGKVIFPWQRIKVT